MRFLNNQQHKPPLPDLPTNILQEQQEMVRDPERVMRKGELEAMFLEKTTEKWTAKERGKLVELVRKQERKKSKYKVTFQTFVTLGYGNQSVMRFMMQLWIKLWPALTMMPRDHEMYQWVGLAEEVQRDVQAFINKLRRVPRRHTQFMTISDSDSEADLKLDRLNKTHGGRKWMKRLWEKTRRAELESAL
ncbi:hypothetical protein Pcinc_021110 [Petrolisthes cinctipes]|uniref:Uncharacterized protein n=1 Tax=Petrolisthes cinctipes TaxID=88211 RepID=A0AAE1FH14_PETCI|nr:hypothetical protein Pcinc_021110 [Petrolisthes cinctipes]